jgi:HlyD family secretion protein
MTSSGWTLRGLLAFALTALLAGCNEPRNPGYQGWVEADMIFVSPDESGRVTKLNIREGDEVKAGEQLYAVDDDLQQANLNQNKATLANAQDRSRDAGQSGCGGFGAARRRSAGGDVSDAAGATHRLRARERCSSADLFP